MHTKVINKKPSKAIGRHHARNQVKQHAWVTIVNPSNKRLLLQACDDCGVVKSENSVIRNCKGANNQALVTRAQVRHMQQSA